MLGAYAASKYAVEGLSDALRMKVAGHGIVSLRQPCVRSAG
jgi:NAD(P)-dependent dehydrogenase (short-subunit alcohol dehydrogenase family)